MRTLFLSALVAFSTTVASAAPVMMDTTDEVASSYIVGESGSVTVTFDYSSAGFNSDLYLVTPDGDDTNDILLFNNKSTASGATIDLGQFDAGTELIFRLYVNTKGTTYYSGDASRNADGAVHARVSPDLLMGAAIIGFEDQLYGGDHDFNDFVIRVQVADVSMPLPAAGILFFFGVGAVAFAGRPRTLV